MTAHSTHAEVAVGAMNRNLMENKISGLKMHNMIMKVPELSQGTIDVVQPLVRALAKALANQSRHYPHLRGTLASIVQDSCPTTRRISLRSSTVFDFSITCADLELHDLWNFLHTRCSL